ncbi:FAD binding domain-containing protein [Halostagnicola kamekurae]|uniref:Carbon-monoxide dehydrogenase medium subunit n=1 Tax=Halostagnicola kamekurae TaxID=619731 RepID=A0A1I6TFN4_9EURY|nr:xanthine dehydrogenase family protein subunit M [Halostagnicola kamekurae]SFS87993.1 carbon-monoxide dehydrogenase medium subunit [Halostagnicola kamekurae]
MFPDEFDYHRAESVDDALDLLAEYPDAEVLAGGHSLLPTMKNGLAKPDVVVDIGHIESMQGIDRNGDATSIGALTTYAEIDDDEELWADATVLTEAASEIGDTQVRNRGTIGGNLAHSDPASDLPGAAIASDLTLVVEGPDGERRIDADEFFVAMYMTDLAEDELLTRIEVPRGDGATSGAYVKKPSPSSGYALVGVAAQVQVDDGTVTTARIGANGVMDHAVRLEPVEDAIEGERLSDDAVSAAAERAADDLEEAMMMDDLQASSEFRSHLLETYTKRALERAAERADATVTA